MTHTRMTDTQGIPYPFFFGYLFRPTRRQGRAWPSLRGSVVLDDTDGRTWARVAVRVRKGELGLWPLGGLVPQGRLAAPAGPSASPTGYGRRAAGQPNRARARERGGRAPEARDGSRAGPQPGRLRHPDPHPGGSPGPSCTCA